MGLGREIDFDALYADLVRQGEYLTQHPVDTWLAMEKHLYPYLPLAVRYTIYAQLCDRGYREAPEPWPRDSWARWLRN